jgi:hypothetical protein
LFTTGSYLKITEVTYIFGLLYTMVKLRDKFGENGLGYILGDFFTNSSGHLVDKIRQLGEKTLFKCIGFREFIFLI